MEKALYFAAMLLATIPALSQFNTPAQEGPVSTVTSTSTLVMIPTLVLSNSGKPVTNLSSQDFRLTEDGREQKVQVERVQTQSAAIVVLMQTGGVAASQFRNYRKLWQVMENMLESPTDKVALVTFDSRPEEIWNFPRRVDALTYAWTHPERGNQGAAILDAVNSGIDLLEQQPKSLRRILLLLSQPQDDGSVMPAREFVRRLAESNITVYSVTFSPKAMKEKKGGHQAIRRNTALPLDRAVKALRENTAAEITKLSGGERAGFDDSDLDRNLWTLANDVPNRYMLSFRPSSKEPGLHTIRVQVKQKVPVDVVARASYWSSY